MPRSLGWDYFFGWLDETGELANCTLKRNNTGHGYQGPALGAVSSDTSALVLVMTHSELGGHTGLVPEGDFVARYCSAARYSPGSCATSQCG